MGESLRHVVGAATGAGLLALLLFALHSSGSDPRQGAVLRLALRTTAGTAEDCRKLSQEELDALPMHMRRPEVCESRAVPYRLTVRVDGGTVLERTYSASGIHGDRPLTIGEEIGVRAGTHDVSLRFEADTAASTATSAPPTFTYERSVQFPDGRVRVASLEGSPAAFTLR